LTRSTTSTTASVADVAIVAAAVGEPAVVDGSSVGALSIRSVS
jgi:hypothetical protein